MTRILVVLSSDCSDVSEVIDALRQRNDEIGLLLLQDGVYLADMGCTHGHDLIRSGLKTYASEKHVEERGLRSRIDKSVNVVGYPDIIDLMMEKYDKVISL